MSADTLNSQYIGLRICAVLRREFGDVRHSRKRLARLLDCDHRKVRNLTDGTNPPRGPDLVLLMAENKALRAEVDRMVEELQCRLQQPK